MDKPVAQSGRVNGIEDIIRELCSCNGLNFQELLQYEHSDATGLEMFFSGFPRIVGLNYFPYLQYLCIVDQNITKIENLCCPLLKELWISETKVSQIEGLQGLVELRKLYLYSNQIRRIENLDHLKNLEVLWLSSNDIEEIEGLTKLQRLRELNLSNNKIRKLGKSLLPNSSLEILMLAGNRLCDLKDVKNLASLLNLRSLTLKDPTYPSTNFVASLFNYAIYVLYHIPQLILLDTYKVESRQLKEFCESVIGKKRSFYRMRLQALKRDYLQSVKFVERLRQPLFKVCVERMRMLHQLSTQLECKLAGRAEDSQLLDALELSRVGNDIVQSQLEDVAQRARHWDQVYEQVQQEYLNMLRDLKALSVFKLRLLELEWTTAGNVRVTELRSKSRVTPWLFAAVCTLVRSRFHAAEFSSVAGGAVAHCGHALHAAHAPTGLKVKTVQRVQNRHLQTRFQDALFSHLQVSSSRAAGGNNMADYGFLPNEQVLKYKRHVNYLFWMDGAHNDAVLEAAERGFGDEEAVQLTNSVFLADRALRDVCWRCELATRTSRTLLLCRTYLGKFATQSGVLGKSQAEKRQQYDKDVTAVVRKQSNVLGSPEKDARHNCNASCSCACHEEPQKLGSLVHDRSCEYVVFEPRFVLPEYLVEFEYCYDGPQVDEINVLSGESYLHRLVSLVTQQAGMHDERYASTQTVLRELATQVAVEDSPYDHAESEQFDAKMITTYNRLMRIAQQDVLQVFDADLANDAGVLAPLSGLLNGSDFGALELGVKQPCKVSKLNDEAFGMLLGPVRAKSLQTLTYLNVSGLGLDSLAEVRTLSNLKTLLASCNELQKLDELSHLHLEHLNVAYNRISTLEGLSAMHKLSHLDLSGNSLTRLTNEMLLLRQHAPNLKTLDLRYNPWQSPAHVLDVQAALKGVRQLNDDSHNVAALEALLRNKVAVWLRNLSRVNDVSVEDDTVAALRQHAPLLLSQAALLQFGRTDMFKRRALTLLSDAQQISSLSSYKPERLHDQDVTWFGKITCLVVDNQPIIVLNGLERLTALRWASFEGNDIIRIDSVDSTCFEQLEEFSLTDNALVRVDELSRLSRVSTLSLSGNFIGQIDPITFSNWSSTLTCLSLDCNRLSTLRGFERLNVLCELYLAHNQLSNVRELFYLKTLSRLLILDVAYNPVCVETDNFRSFVIYHLRALKALNGQLIEMHEVNFAKELFGGRLTCDFISEKYALSSSDFSELPELDLANQSLRTVDLGVNCAQTFAALRSVNLEHNNMTSFSGLIYLPNLKVLCLNFNRIECIIPPTPTASKHIVDGVTKDGSAPPILERLEVLYLGSNQIRDLVALQLYRLPSLRSLFLHCNEVTKLEGLEGLKNLRELVLDKNKLSSVSEQAFLTNWNLVELHIEDNRLKELQNLNSLEKLQRLYLGGNRVHALAEIRKLDGLQNLLELSLYANPVTRHHDYRLCVVQRLQNLKVLDGLPISDDERLRAEMYLLEQQALQQAAQTGTLEVLAPANELALPSNSLVLGRNVSLPIKITNVHLFSMQQGAASSQAFLAAQNAAAAQSGNPLPYPQLNGLQFNSQSGNALEMNLIRKQQPATIKYNQPSRTAKNQNSADSATVNQLANAPNSLGSANSGKVSLAQRYQRVQTRIAALDNARNSSQYTNAQEEISRFLKNPRKD